MSTRQYIGARYVPQFYEGAAGSTEWVENVPYEALTMVTHLGNTYTSKKPVPVGVNINDTNYWVITGNYNAQVEEYRRITEEVEASYNLLTHKRYVLIGDSIGFGAGLTSGGWCHSFKRIFNLSDTDCYINAEGGAGFCNRGDYQHNFKDLLDIDSVTDRDSITDIVVYGGVNDGAYTDEYITQAVVDFCVRAKSLYSNATVHIGFEGWFVGDWYAGLQLTTRNMHKVLGAIKNGTAVSQNAHYMANSEYIMHNPTLFQSDGLHATQTGVDKIAVGLKEAIAGSLDVTYPYITADLTLTDSTSTSGNILTGLNNNVTSVLVNDLQIGYQTGKNMTFDYNLISLGEIHNSFYLGNTLSFDLGIYENARIPVKVMITTNNDGFYCANGFLIVAQNMLFLNLELLNRAGSNYLSTMVTNLKITGYFTSDSMLQ